MVSHRSLSDSKSPQVSRILLNILTDLNNDVVWMISTRPLISKSSSPLVTVPSAPITIGITVTFMFHSFFSSVARSFNSLSFNFTQWSAETIKSTMRHVFFFFSLFFFFDDYNKVWFSSLDHVICLYPKIPLYLKISASHSPGRILGCAFLAQFPVNHLPHPVVSSFILFLS